MSRFDTVVITMTDGEEIRHTCSYARVVDGVLVVQDSDSRDPSINYPLVHVRRWTVERR